MVPKNLAIAAPERAALVLAPVLLAVATALAPLVRALDLAAGGLLRAVGVRSPGEVSSAFTAEEVAAIVSRSRQEGLLEDRYGLLASALELRECLARDIMVPYARLVMFSMGMTPSDVEQLVGRTGFSRFPVTRDAAPGVRLEDVTDSHLTKGDVPTRSDPATDPDLVGYLHIKDLLYADDERYLLPVPAKRVRSLVTVEAGEDIQDALETMRRSGTHLARVVEGAGTVGVLFLEDVLEELVGEVFDATQRGDPP